VAVRFRAELVLVHIIPAVVQSIPADPAFDFQAPEPYEQALTVSVEERLNAMAQRTSSEVKSRTAIGNGDAADGIVRLAVSEGADLIVIANHGSTGWRHLFFGSVAEKVIRLSDLPVLVVPIKKPE